jgi:hypothetical protein
MNRDLLSSDQVGVRHALGVDSPPELITPYPK